jgi:hypothetical protein
VYLNLLLNDTITTVIGRRNWSTQRKSAPMPLCPPQIPHDQNWEWTQVMVGGNQQLTAWAVAWPILGCDTLQCGRSLLTFWRNILPSHWMPTAWLALPLWRQRYMSLGHISISIRLHGFRTPEDISFHSYHCDDHKYHNWHNVHMTFWLGIASWISPWSTQ